VAGRAFKEHVESHGCGYRGPLPDSGLRFVPAPSAAG
jgi:hypothetical protein